MNKRSKPSYKKLHDENWELKTKTTLMKSQDEKLKELRKMVEDQETIEKKWVETLFHYKQQQEALGSQIEPLIKEKKEKENVLIHSKLVNMKSASLLNSEEIRRRAIEIEKEKLVEANKAYQRNLQQLQAQLEATNEQKKSLDLVGVKKWLEDYEQMLQYYTLMRIKNKMKDFDVEFWEWWEAQEYFAKELKKHLAQHKANERILRYKLEIYHKKFLEFICGSPTSIQTLGQDEEVEVGPIGIIHEEKVQAQEPQEFKRGGGQEKKEPQTIHEQ